MKPGSAEFFGEWLARKTLRYGDELLEFFTVDEANALLEQAYAQKLLKPLHVSSLAMQKHPGPMGFVHLAYAGADIVEDADAS